MLAERLQPRLLCIALFQSYGRHQRLTSRELRLLSQPSIVGSLPVVVVPGCGNRSGYPEAHARAPDLVGARAARASSAGEARRRARQQCADPGPAVRPREPSLPFCVIVELVLEPAR